MVFIYFLAIAIMLGVAAALVIQKRRRLTTRKSQAPVSDIGLPKPDLLTEKLGKTRVFFKDRLENYFRFSKHQISDNEWAKIEEALLEGDVGTKVTALLLDKVRQRIKDSPSNALAQLFCEETEAFLGDLPHGLMAIKEGIKPYVISVVGVNGAGKTTTIGKLAHHFATSGKKVLLGAADTFRAAAKSQLSVWAERTRSEIVVGKEGADPGAVAFDAVAAGKARGVDVVILDTAGRLHTKSNLMEELKKVHRVVKKVIADAPHEIWLVVDGTSGQNIIQQAKEFSKTLELSGLIVTKLDGTAKGGAVISVVSELRVPIVFVGIGESVEDLVLFEPKTFVKAIFAPTMGV